MTFGLVVLLPQVGVSLIIYNINQTALRKELVRFTEHTAEALFKDLDTELSWQREQSRMVTQLLRAQTPLDRRFPDAAAQIFQLTRDFEALGLYDADGPLIQRAYRNFPHLSPELRLEDPLPADVGQRLQAGQPVYTVPYSNTGPATETVYRLRLYVPVEGRRVLVLQKPFTFLQSLIQQRRQTLYDGLLLIDDTGAIIAGPDAVVQEKRHISPADLAFFQKLKPGVTQTYVLPPDAARQQATAAKADEDSVPALEKVIVKMPEINWGLVIESPYHVQQTYVKRARTQSLLLLLACVTVTLGLGLVYALSIHRNFRQLMKATKAMAQGNLSRRVRLIRQWITPYEIIVLAGEFNRMAKKMSESWWSVQTLNGELREANRQLAKLDDLKSNLIDTVSHELRTPLTIIKGHASRLLRYDDQQLDPETRRRSLQLVKQQADRLSRLVEDLLVIPDLETSTLRVFPDQVFLVPLLERCVHSIQAKEHRPIQLAGALAPELMVLADPDRLEQVVLNLLDNAMKYALPDGDIRLSVDVDTPAPDRVRVTVSNPSPPIPTEVLSTLFEKFKRLDDSMVRTTRGSGLGLFITQGLVAAMGGEVGLEYRDGQFQAWFWLLRAEVEGGTDVFQPEVGVEAV